MEMRLCFALLVGCCSATALAEVPDALIGDALAGCPASNLDQAAQCLNDHLPSADLKGLRTDQQFDREVYQAIIENWNLKDPNAPLSVGLRTEGLDHVALAPALIIGAAKALQSGAEFNRAPYRNLIEQLITEERKARAEWQPPLRNGAVRVDLSQCPDSPARTHPRAACLKQRNGTLVVVKPLWEPKDPVRGN